MTLARQRVLIAYGLLGEVSAAFRPIGIDYLGAQQDWLRAAGARPEVVRVPTAAPVADNAAVLRTALLAEDRPALVLAHSKGGLEALAALLDPDVAARCSGFIAFQSPFAGTPIADAVTGLRPLHGAAVGALRLLRIGSGAGLLDLTTAVRAAWMARHGAAVAALLARLPVVAAGTVLALPEDAAFGRDRAYGIAARWLAQRAGPNDGLVPLASALLPGARHMVEPGGHVALVATGAGRDPVGALQRALALLAEGSAEAA